MEKLFVNKGFTLIEMIFVLLIMSILSLTLILKNYDESILKWNMNKMKSYLLCQKREALLLKENKDIVIKNNSIWNGQSMIYLHPKIVCDNYEFKINERGNVNKGGSIVCSYGTHERSLIINLGNGNFYVK